MQNPVAQVYCANVRCQALNLQSHNFCQQCRTPLVKRYLWALGEGIEAATAGMPIADRYLLISQRILLDIKPGLPPATVEEIPAAIAPYLKLSPYKLHVPQVYGLMQLPAEGGLHREIWLLEEVPIYSNSAGGNSWSQVEHIAPGQLMPELTSLWQNAPALRQLNWLWQIAQLWQPLSSQGVVTSLFHPKLLRVEGSLIRLLQLQPDQTSTPTLKQLGRMWSEWAQSASPEIVDFLAQLCQMLVQGQVRNSEQLVDALDRAMAECDRLSARQIQIATLSDTGPSRRRNEDSCYPPSGESRNISAADLTPLAIVCDGIGGHEGGDIASRMAIESIQQQVENLAPNAENWHPTNLTLELELAVATANDAISQRNDQEKRQDRQRMGTTLVATLVRGHEIYIIHVGDSRVYRITPTGCHQVTLDDDIASREVRLGYSIYRDAVQQPISGSLVQALGMSPSTTLHPNVQRLILDEECVFLLCSDGLSDRDRVEQYWETEILPVLDGQIDVATAAQRLVQIGNTQNGHDNVTVALVYCQRLTTASPEKMAVSLPQILPVPTSSLTANTKILPPQDPLIPDASSQMKTRRLLSPPPSSIHPKAFAISFLLVGLIGSLAAGLAYWLIPGVKQLTGDGKSGNRSVESPISLPVPSPSPDPTNSSNSSLTAGSFIRLKSSPTGQNTLAVLPIAATESQIQSVQLIVPNHGVLQVVEKQLRSDSDSWLQLQVVSPNSETNKSAVPTSPAAKKTGWIQETVLKPFILETFKCPSNRLEKCE